MNRGRLLCEVDNSEIKRRFTAAPPPAYLIVSESISYLKKEIGKTAVGIQSYNESLDRTDTYFLALNDTGAYRFLREGKSSVNVLSGKMVLFDNKSTALHHLNEEIATVVWSKAMLYRVSLSAGNDVVLKITVVYDPNRSCFYLEPGKHKIHPDNYEGWIEKIIAAGGIAEVVGKRKVEMSLQTEVNFSDGDNEYIVARPGKYVFTRIPTSEFMSAV